MEGGAHGVLLVHAAVRVAVELNLDQEPAPIQDHNMEEEIVLVQILNRCNVIQDHVQVCRISCW